MTNRPTGESIRVNSIELTRIDNIFNHPVYPPEVKIPEIHEPSSFLKRGYKLQSIRTIRVDSIESSRIDNIFNPPSKSRSTIFSKSHTNRLPACRIDRRGNDLCRFDGIGFTNRFPVCRIANTKDESTLVGCIGQPYQFVSGTFRLLLTQEIFPIIFTLKRPTDSNHFTILISQHKDHNR